MLDAFGAQIANTDRHLDNVLLYPTESGYALAPAFDQLPMAYAPPASGNLRTTAVDPVKPTVDTFDVWDEASVLAGEYWHRATELELSDSMTAIVANHVTR